MINRIHYCCALALFISTTFPILSSASALDNALAPSFNALPAGHNTSYLITDTNTGERLASHNQEQLQAPASTQKLLTALAATLYLPADFQFETTLALSESNHNQDVVITFSGDPLLSRQQLAQLLKTLKQQGIRHLDGNIYLNGKVFSGNEHVAGLPWDILGVCYSAPASSISLEHNCVQGALYSNKPLGQLTRVNVPSHQPIRVTTNATIVDKTQQKAQFCELNLSAKANNHYQLSGCLIQRDKPLPLNFAVQDTVKYTADVIKKELQRTGIRFSGQVLRNDNAQGKVIARHHSKPLSELIDILLKDSDNLIADNLAKTLGRLYYDQAGNFANGTHAIKAILKEKAGLNLDNAVLADGSGLSRNNRLSAAQLNEVLTYIHQHNETLKLLETFPVADQSGTLRYRPSVRKPPLAGNLTAKTGSLYGAANLAGFITTQSGKKLTVVQLVNSYHPIERDSEKPITPAITLFEQAFYTTLYHYDFNRTPNPTVEGKAPNQPQQ